MQNDSETNNAIHRGRDLDPLSLEDTFSSLPKLLAKRQEALEERERELKHREEVLKSALGGAEPSDVLQLNVGGRTGIAVLRRTLTTFKDSMLAAKFSGRWDDSLERDKDGNIFIDQDPDLFITLVNFLRDRGCESEGAPGLLSPEATNRFCRLVSYYGLTWDVYPIELVPTRGNTHTIIEMENYPHFSMSALVLEPFDLVSVGHKRLVRSYEIEVVHATELQVGWRDQEQCFDNSFDYSVFLDCMEKCTLNRGSQGMSSEMENVRITSGTKIRCSRQEKTNEYKWCIGDATELLESTYCTFESPIPCFIFCGTLRVTQIQYE